MSAFGVPGFGMSWLVCFVIVGVKHGWLIVDVQILMCSFSPTRYFHRATVGSVLIILSRVSLTRKITKGDEWSDVNSCLLIVSSQWCSQVRPSLSQSPPSQSLNLSPKKYGLESDSSWSVSTSVLLNNSLLVLELWLCIDHCGWGFYLWKS